MVKHGFPYIENYGRFAVPCLASNEWAAGWQSETNSRDAENFL